MAAAISPRTGEVLELVQEGLTASEVSKRLGISRNAVYQHIGKLREDGYLPPRARDRDEGSLPSVDRTLEQFRRTLEDQLRQIDKRTEELDSERARLHEERERVVAHIERMQV